MLIGRDVLRALTLDVDWPNARARFVRPAAFRPPAGAWVAPTRKTGGALMAPIAIEEIVATVARAEPHLVELLLGVLQEAD